MDLILIAIAVVVLIGLVSACILSYASKIFAVPVDETFVKLRAVMPGANCGGCGYAGCDDYANALTEDHSLSCSKCPVGGADVAEKLGEILGVSAGSAEKQVAVVMCNGTSRAAKKLMEYEGVKTCTAAKQFFGGINQCKHGCMGLGDCVTACPYNSIYVCDGVAVVNRETCVGCGLCAKVCPNQTIRISPAKNLVVVQCKSTDKGAATMKACVNGCIGCKKCQKACKFDAITVEDNLAFIDPEKCKNCGMCVKECPTGAINNMRVKKTVTPKKEVEKPKAEKKVEPQVEVEAKTEESVEKEA